MTRRAGHPELCIITDYGEEAYNGQEGHHHHDGTDGEHVPGACLVVTVMENKQAEAGQQVERDAEPVHDASLVFLRDHLLPEKPHGREVESARELDEEEGQEGFQRVLLTRVGRESQHEKGKENYQDREGKYVHGLEVIFLGGGNAVE